jgi:hypothetical protein
LFQEELGLGQLWWTVGHYSALVDSFCNENGVPCFAGTRQIVIGNKARIVAQDYTQVEGLDFGKTYAPVARLKAIRILLAYACAHSIKLYQIDVKSKFLMGTLMSLCMLRNLSVLKIRRRPTMVTS